MEQSEEPPPALPKSFFRRSLKRRTVPNISEQLKSVPYNTTSSEPPPQVGELPLRGNRPIQFNGQTSEELREKRASRDKANGSLSRDVSKSSTQSGKQPQGASTPASLLPRIPRGDLDFVPLLSSDTSVLDKDTPEKRQDETVATRSVEGGVAENGRSLESRKESTDASQSKALQNFNEIAPKDEDGAKKQYRDSTNKDFHVSRFKEHFGKDIRSNEASDQEPLDLDVDRVLKYDTGALNEPQGTKSVPRLQPSPPPEMDPHAKDKIDFSSTEDINVEREFASPVIHETTRPHRHLVRHEHITREIHTYDVYYRILPLVDVEVKPTRHFLRNAEGELVEVAEGDIPNYVARMGGIGSFAVSTTGMGSQISSDSTAEAIHSLRNFTARPIEQHEQEIKRWVDSDGVERSEQYHFYPPTFLGAKMADVTTKERAASSTEVSDGKEPVREANEGDQIA